jgi:hypothetical protein
MTWGDEKYINRKEEGEFAQRRRRRMYQCLLK